MTQILLIYTDLFISDHLLNQRHQRAINIDYEII